MKKIVMMAVLLAGAGAFADDSYLYWQLKPLCDDPFVLREFEYAYLTVTDQGGNALKDAGGQNIHLAVYDQSGARPYAVAPSDAGSEPWLSMSTPPVFSALGDYANSQYGFMIEAYLDGALTFHTGVGYYDDLVAANHVWKGSASAMDPSVTVWAMQVPEPTSRLLLLLGVVGLALRRRRNAM